jgi:splicing factor 45
MSLYGDLPPLPGENNAATASVTAATTPASAPPSATRVQPSPRPAMMQVPRSLTMAAKTPTLPVKTAAQTAALLAQVQQRIAEQKAAQAAAQAATASVAPASQINGPPASSASVPFYLSSRSDSGVSPLVAAAAAAASVDDEGSLFGLTSAQLALQYNPLFPNDYESYVTVRDKRRREEKEAAEQRRERERQRRRGSESDDEYESSQQQLPVVVIAGSTASSSAHATSASQWNNSIPQPATPANPNASSKLDLGVSSGEEAYQRRLAMSRGVAPVQTNIQQQPVVAAQQSYDSNKRPRTDGVCGAPPVPSMNVVPSRVILLLNMVGRGETDEGLEEETADECAKYGKVIKCTVFEVPLSTSSINGVNNISDSEAVRIFVKFDQLTSAINAQRELEGRPFGGRIVRAKFYDESAFNKGQLAP